MEVPQLPLVQFLVVIDTPVVFVMTGACAGPDSAENCGFSAVGAALGQGF